MQGLSFLVFWLGCFGLTLLAIVVALLDALAVRRQSRLRQKELLDATLQNIQAEARARPRQRPERS